MNKFLSLSRLNLKVFLGQPIGIVIGGLIPVMIMTILPYLFNGIANIGADVPLRITLSQLIPGLVLLPTLIIGFVGIPITLSTIKGTNLLKKIRMTNVSPLLFLSSFIFTFLVIIIVLTLFLFGLAKAIWQNDAPNPSGAAFLIPWVIIIVSSIAFGLLIGNASNNTMTSFALGMASFLPVMFLSGIFFAQMDGWVDYFAKIIPQNHLANIFKVAWFNNSPVIESYQTDVHSVISINLMGITPDTILGYIYPIGLIFAQVGYMSAKFKWE